MSALDPWGPFDWMIARAPVFTKDVFCLAAVGPEERCNGAPLIVKSFPGSSVGLVRVTDPPSSFTQRIDEKTDAHWEKVKGPGVHKYDAHLLATDQTLFDAFSLALSDGGAKESVILDITCLPKRYFFFFLKLLLKDTSIRNVLIVYTQPGPEGYASPHLSGSPDEVRALPGFAPTTEPTTLVVSVGFEPLGLPQFLSEYRDKKRRIVLLVPFPPGQPYAQRTWQVLQKLRARDFGGDTKRIAAIDAFDTVRQLRAVEAAEQAKAAPSEVVSIALAPYGPKPMSVGMALYAIESGSPVLYTQPMQYHPDYSSGCGKSWAYVVKYRGQAVQI